ncbi:MFS general substrate transporter, partial [Linderina pennispora]
PRSNLTDGNYVDSDAATLDPPADEAPADCAKEFPKYTRYAVVASCFMLQALSCGSIHSWGIQQEYLIAHDFAGDKGRIKTLSYIGTLMYFGVLAGLRFGRTKRCALLASFSWRLALMAASFCSEPWQLCLALGIIFGLGGGIVYSPASTASARWFTKRRGLATGIALAGVGIGGLVIAPLTEFLVRTVGVPWSQRIASIYIIVFGSISFDWSAFRDRSFAVQALMVFFATAAYIVPVTYWPQFWTSKGISPETASVMIAISNVSNAVGRIVIGVTADYIGVLNSLMIGVGCSTIGALVIWPFATSVGSGLVMGINLRVCAWIGIPAASEILATSGHGTDFIGMIIYTGVLWAVSFFFASYNRLSYSRQVFVKV